MADRLNSGQKATSNPRSHVTVLAAPNNNSFLRLFPDGNLGLSDGKKNYWTAFPLSAKDFAAKVIKGQPGPYTLTMQSDGNLTLRGSKGIVYWSTKTPVPGASAVLQNDKNLVIYPPKGGKALWAAAGGGFPQGGFNLTELASIAIGLPPGAFTILKAASPEAGKWAENAVSTAGRAAGSAVDFVSKATNDLSKEVGKVPFVGPLFSGLVDVTLGGPWHMGHDLVHGVPLDKAIARELKRQLNDFKEIGPYAQMVFSLVPGFGPFVAGAIGAGLALANGQPLDQVLLAGVSGMAPGGPLVKMAIDAGIKVVQIATKPGGLKNLGDISSIASIAVNALPVSPMVKDMITGGLSVVGNLCSGQRLDQALIDGVMKALPLGDMPADAKNAIMQAGNAIKSIARGVRVDKALIEGGIQALPIGRLHLPADAERALKNVADAGVRITQGQHVDKALFDAAVKSIPASIIPAQAKDMLHHLDGLVKGMADQVGAASKIVDIGQDFLKKSGALKGLPDNFQTMLKTGMALGHGAGLQDIVKVSVQKGGLLENAAKAAVHVVTSSKVAAAARTKLTGEVQKGFDVGLGLMSHAAVGLTSLGTIRSALPPETKKGFDMAVSLHIGVTTRSIAASAPPAAAAGFAMTAGMIGATSTQKTGMMAAIAVHADMRSGAAAAISQTETAREGFFEWLIRVITGGKAPGARLMAGPPPPKALPAPANATVKA